MSIQFNGSPDDAGAMWVRLCVKNGHPEAASAAKNGLPVGATTNQLHEIRKDTRRAVNSVTDGMKPEDFANDAVSDGLMYAAKIIRDVDQTFQRMTEAEIFFGGSKTKTVMRNSADFKAHYGKRGGNSDEGQFDVADFLRGIANLKTSPDVRNALSVGTGSAGGFTVPSQLMPGILSALVPASSLLTAGAGIVVLEDGASV